ncbi:MAG TPA: hypothetical protein VFY65_19265 [Longimicrobium sp.]|nr:hypothetical protein [Longimicrobium sp.]
MDFARVEDYSVFPWPERLWFVVVFLIAAVAVARVRPGWLWALWLGAWLLAVTVGMLRLPHDWVQHEPVMLLAEILLASGVPTGLTALWLARTRRHRLLGRAAVQAVGAPAVYLCGLMAVALLLTAPWAVA